MESVTAPSNVLIKQKTAQNNVHNYDSCKPIPTPTPTRPSLSKLRSRPRAPYQLFGHSSHYYTPQLIHALHLSDQYLSRFVQDIFPHTVSNIFQPDKFFVNETYNSSVWTPIHPEEYYRLITKGLAGQSIRMAITGGSISRGAGLADSQLNWAYFLKEYLLHIFSHANTTIEYENMAVGATDSAYYAICINSHLTQTRPQNKPDASDSAELQLEARTKNKNNCNCKADNTRTETDSESDSDSESETNSHTDAGQETSSASATASTHLNSNSAPSSSHSSPSHTPPPSTDEDVHLIDFYLHEMAVNDVYQYYDSIPKEALGSAVESVIRTVRRTQPQTAMMGVLFNNRYCKTIQQWSDSATVMDSIQRQLSQRVARNECIDPHYTLRNPVQRVFSLYKLGSVSTYDTLLKTALAATADKCPYEANNAQLVDFLVGVDRGHPSTNVHKVMTALIARQIHGIMLHMLQQAQKNPAFWENVLNIHKTWYRQATQRDCISSYNHVNLSHIQTGESPTHRLRKDSVSGVKGDRDYVSSSPNSTSTNTANVTYVSRHLPVFAADLLPSSPNQISPLYKRQYACRTTLFPHFGETLLPDFQSGSPIQGWSFDQDLSYVSDQGDGSRVGRRVDKKMRWLVQSGPAAYPLRFRVDVQYNHSNIAISYFSAPSYGPLDFMLDGDASTRRTVNMKGPFRSTRIAFLYENLMSGQHFLDVISTGHSADITAIAVGHPEN